MTGRTVTLDELRDRSLEEVLEEAIESDVAFHVRLPSGVVVDIQPRPKLSPLPVLDGRLRPDWREHIYSERGE